MMNPQQKFKETKTTTMFLMSKLRGYDFKFTYLSPNVIVFTDRVFY